MTHDLMHRPEESARQRVEAHSRQRFAEERGEDELSAARGFFNGLLLGMGFWIVVALITLAWFKL